MLTNPIAALLNSKSINIARAEKGERMSRHNRIIKRRDAIASFIRALQETDKSRLKSLFQIAL
jgi:hypothetical protein